MLSGHLGILLYIGRSRMQQHNSMTGWLEMQKCEAYVGRPEIIVLTEHVTLGIHP